MTTEEQVFFEIHRGNPREGPGSDASTRRAFGMVPRLAPGARILDIGCGPGAQTLCLAGLADAEIHALDLYSQYLSQLSSQVAARGLGDRVFPIQGDMSAPSFHAAAFDLIWAEGSIYILGFEKGLRTWRPFLKAGGCIAVTEASWFKRDPPAEVADFWRLAYPAMMGVQDNLELMAAAGYEPIGHFSLSESDWLDRYYGPISAKLDTLKAKYAHDEGALTVIASEEAEIELYRKYADCYGYVFYIARKATD